MADKRNALTMTSFGTAAGASSMKVMPQQNAFAEQGSAMLSSDGFGQMSGRKSESVINTLLEEQKSSNKRMTALSKHVPEELLQKAVDKLSQFRLFRNELKQDVKHIAGLVGRLRQKISSKLHSDNKWTGVLMSRRDKYFTCLNIDEKGLDQLFENDNQHWVE